MFKGKCSSFCPILVLTTSYITHFWVRWRSSQGGPFNSLVCLSVLIYCLSYIAQLRYYPSPQWHHTTCGQRGGRPKSNHGQTMADRKKKDITDGAWCWHSIYVGWLQRNNTNVRRSLQKGRSFSLQCIFLLNDHVTGWSVIMWLAGLWSCDWLGWSCDWLGWSCDWLGWSCDWLGWARSLIWGVIMFSGIE